MAAQRCGRDSGHFGNGREDRESELVATRERGRFVDEAEGVEGGVAEARDYGLGRGARRGDGLQCCWDGGWGLLATERLGRGEAHGAAERTQKAAETRGFLHEKRLQLGIGQQRGEGGLERFGFGQGAA